MLVYRVFLCANRSLRPVCCVEETACCRGLCVFLLICTDKSTVLPSVNEQPAAGRGPSPSFIQHNIEHNAEVTRVNGRASNLALTVKDNARPLQGHPFLEASLLTCVSVTKCSLETKTDSSGIPPCETSCNVWLLVTGQSCTVKPMANDSRYPIARQTVV